MIDFDLCLKTMVIKYGFCCSMGMLHDADRGCTGSNIGVMGGYGTGWSSCSKNDMDALLQ